jgi:hypothetical protein
VIDYVQFGMIEFFFVFATWIVAVLTSIFFLGFIVSEATCLYPSGWSLFLTAIMLAICSHS